MKLLKTPKSRGGGKLKTLLAVGVCSGAILCASADAPAWPDTFWTQVSSHVAAVTPSGGQVGESANPEAFGSFAYQSFPGAGFGSVAAPFDSVCWLYLFTGTLWLDPRPPAGFCIDFK